MAAVIERWTVTGPEFRGFYNVNAVAQTDAGVAIVRSRIPATDQMDLRPLDEVAILEAIAGRVYAPQVWRTDPARRFFVCSFVGEATLNEISPRGTAVMMQQMDSIIGTMAALTTVPVSAFVAMQRDSISALGLPVTSTLDMLVSHLGLLANEAIERRPILAAALSLPSVDGIVSAIPQREVARPDVLMHCDLHRKNLRTGAPGGGLYVLDWELALVGDPLYDLAVHIHKMSYPEWQKEAFISAWKERVMPTGWSDRDFGAYLAIERSKSAYVDLLRSMQNVLQGTVDAETMAIKYRSKLVDLARVVDVPVPSVESIAAEFRAEAARNEK
ncbi:hypothetical protein ACWT_0638 [Actinoplanes sp. SE50]|uniref:aminoglycoside phosphotransferase family protein n=1 Tax=unclassified Actinoplanes TaxID=2626549 RepID=UPI00023ED190|nr:MULTISPECIES: aminoglycoside phosphotransferase family protein [unclassified Actinoplanes]AEV81652.1 hypothetical protein ACPL_755 [Actinoplanes sp. SE50/110]ATO80053.1 hypothetical protein ACWT_0638 [Actinoplanes sp. SE50]SLL97457.1 thiamine kinase [Actinoplanes sp. SE50/110]